MAMVNTNRFEGWFAPRRTGIVGLPGIGQHFTGWKMPWWSCILPAKGELYSWRRSLARLAEKRFPNILDVFGSGWNCDEISCLRILNKRPYNSCKEGRVPDKYQTIAQYRFAIAVENYCGREGYISEKILDAFVSGSVPVYLGDSDICDVVPSEAFVDVRNFRSQKELLRYLVSCPRSEWTEMYQAGQAFVKSETIKEFSTERYIDKMNRILVQILGL